VPHRTLKYWRGVHLPIISDAKFPLKVQAVALLIREVH